jgi:hypothetical protein
MFLGISTLIIAILISVVAAYYSILGLTAIFAAAFWPVVIMGGALEAGKVLAAVWLHRNWQRASRAYKMYLVPALVFLMLLTSMGIFGFLSKAHLDQAVPAGDVAAQVQIYDDKIKTQRDNIEAARNALRQLDAAVDQTMSRSNDEKGAERAVQIRRNQARERSRLQDEISESQAEIVKLQEQRAPAATQLRKVEAEVGPIKYVAALIYGDTLDQNLLEAAVRWVIILIVLVFDPLAIVLILAGSKQIEWTRGIDFAEEDHHKEVMRRREIMLEENASTNDTKKQEQKYSWFTDIKNRLFKRNKEAIISAEEIKTIDEINSHLSDVPIAVDIDNLIVEAEKIKNAELELEKKITDAETTIEQQKKDINERDQALIELNESLDNVLVDVEKIQENSNMILERNLDLLDQVDSLKKSIIDIETEKNVIEESVSIKELEIESLHSEIADLKKQIEEIEKIVEETTLSEITLAPVADNQEPLPAASNAGFGNQFPDNPGKGDLFLRVDYLPTKLFKWNDSKWIEIDKSLTDTYTYNEKYIQHLISRLEKGEYDTEDLSDNERFQISEYLNRQNNVQ